MGLCIEAVEIERNGNERRARRIALEAQRPHELAKGIIAMLARSRYRGLHRDQLTVGRRTTGVAQAQRQSCCAIAGQGALADLRLSGGEDRDGQVVLAAELCQQAAVDRQTEGKEGAAGDPGSLLGARQQRRRQPQSADRAGVALKRRPGPRQRQVKQWRRIGEGLQPIGAGVGLREPFERVRYIGRPWGGRWQERFMLRYPRRVEGAKLASKELHGPAVGQDVRLNQHQAVELWADTHKSDPEKGAAFQVERPARFFPQVARRTRFSLARQIAGHEIRLDPRVNDLRGAVGSEGGAQGIVSLHDRMNGIADGILVAGALQSQNQRLVVGTGSLLAEGRKVPERLLRRGQGQTLFDRPWNAGGREKPVGAQGADRGADRFGNTVQISVAVRCRKKAGAPFPDIDAIAEHVMVKEVIRSGEAKQRGEAADPKRRSLLCKNGIEPLRESLGTLIQLLL